MISPNELNRITNSLTEAECVKYAALFNELAAKYSLNKWQVFLANILHESGEFSILTENMNYTTAARIAAIWPSRFTVASALPFVRQPQKLANQVYNGRMGNRRNSNDGWNFRGGGYAQITGRDAYTLYTAYVNKRDNTRLTIEGVAALVRSEELWAMDSALWFFCVWKRIDDRDSNFDSDVVAWNGGRIGMADRLKYFNALA